MERIKQPGPPESATTSLEHQSDPPGADKGTNQEEKLDGGEESNTTGCPTKQGFYSGLKSQAQP